MSTLMNRRIVLSAGLASLAVALTGMGRPRKVLVKKQRAFEYAIKASPIDEETVGLVCWDDGFVVYAAGLEGGRAVRVGTVDLVKLTEAKTRIQRTGLFNPEVIEPTRVPDASLRIMRWFDGDRSTVRKWDEVVRPRYGHNIDPSPAFEEFVGAWMRAKVAMLLLVPKEAKDIGEVPKDTLSEYDLQL